MTCLEDIPRLPIDDALEDPNRDEDNENPDKRRPMRLLDALVQRDDEFSDSEDEGEGGRGGREDNPRALIGCNSTRPLPLAESHSDLQHHSNERHQVRK